MKENRPIRILQVGMSPYYGGTESFIMNQYRCINRNKVQFDFLNVYKTEIACQQEIEKLGGRIYYLDMNRHNGMSAYHKKIDDFFTQNAKEFDAVHCNYQSLINVDILRYAKKYGIQVRIAHAHNSGYGKEPSFIQKLLIRKNKKVLYQSATHYFACSKLAAKWMFYRDAIVINNAIDVEKFTFDAGVRKQIRNELGLENCRVVMFTGRLDPQKNPIFLLEIFSEILKRWNDAQLLVVGDGILKDQMTNKIEQLKLHGHVKMLGSRRDVNLLLQAADVFLLPSKFEGLGIVLIEAQAAGVLTYTSDTVVPSDVRITDLLEFISLQKSAADWAEIITKKGILAHCNTKKEICDAGYDNESNAKKLEDLYLSFVRGNS